MCPGFWKSCAKGEAARPTLLVLQCLTVLFAVLAEIGLTAKFEGRQYVTVLGSHDGMAMKQAAELLPAAEANAGVERVRTNAARYRVVLEFEPYA